MLLEAGRRYGKIPRIDRLVCDSVIHENRAVSDSEARYGE